MIVIYLFFGLLIAYAIRLYIKRDEPFETIEPKDLKKEITYISLSQPMDNALDPINWYKD
ncbi:hypothetical protein A45J_2623 [hot springs metagenome]|uniref:Uncharacterized protein n=1 Tax=hot springs metagenome TaxID=433727 RepID=A0A5J4L7X8_9ZZZZ